MIWTNWLQLYLTQPSYSRLRESETELLFARIQSMDPHALAELHDQLYPQVYRYVCYRVDDPHLCEDITAEVFVRLLDVLHTRKNDIQSVKAWLFGTANHLVIDHLRQKYRRPVENIDTQNHLTDGTSPEKVSDHHFVQHELRRALQKLTKEQQHVLSLRFSQELSIEETAQLMKKSVSAVKVLQFRALAALRKHLIGSDPHD